MDLEPSSCGTRRIAVAVVAALMAHAALALATPTTPPTLDVPEPTATLVWLEPRLEPAAHLGTVALATAPRASAPKRRVRRIAPVTTETLDAKAPPSSELAVPEGAHAAVPSTTTESAQSATAGALVSAHGPALLPAGSSCASHFPRHARADHGEVQVIVDVDATGHARVTNVLAEYPNGQGFDAAARSCTANLRFDPAIDVHGTKVGGHAKLRLRFDRRRA